MLMLLESWKLKSPNRRYTMKTPLAVIGVGFGMGRGTGPRGPSAVLPKR